MSDDENSFPYGDDDSNSNLQDVQPPKDFNDLISDQDIMAGDGAFQFRFPGEDSETDNSIMDLVRNSEPVIEERNSNENVNDDIDEPTDSSDRNLIENVDDNSVGSRNVDNNELDDNSEISSDDKILKAEEIESMNEDDENDILKEENENLNKEENENLIAEGNENLNEEENENLIDEENENLHEEENENLIDEEIENSHEEGNENLNEEENENLRNEGNENLYEEENENLRDEGNEHLYEEENENLNDERNENLNNEENENLNDEENDNLNDEENDNLNDGDQDNSKDDEKYNSIDEENYNLNDERNECLSDINSNDPESYEDILDKSNESQINKEDSPSLDRGTKENERRNLVENSENGKDAIYNVEDLQINDPNNSYMDSDANKENESDNKINKRRSDEGLEIRDELDFEEEKESGEESEGEKDDTQREPINKEEGELTDEDEDDSLLRQEPKTVCRFFNKGQCTWGTNCRFLHPGVSDKGNYNMFAAPKPHTQSEKDENSPDKEKPREVRRYIPEPVGFESAWERGLRHAKEMMKRANKRKETDADFEEKRFNLSLGQAELDRENDYYTRPASPVYKPSDEVIEYLDPYEKQAIRHFRGGHFENFEVRYKVDPAYPNRGPEHIRSRRDKFEREVTERIPRRMRATSPAADEPQKTVKEKRYPRPRTWKEERTQEAPPITAVGKEAEVWADPWARRKTPVKRTKKLPRNRSYSSGSSSRSSRSSRSSSYSSYSRSGSRSTSRSRSSRSSSRSITPPIHPRQQRAFMNRGGIRGGRGRGGDRGGRGGGGGGGPRNMYLNQAYNQAPNPPPNHPLAPDVNFQRHPGHGVANRRDKGRDARDIRLPNQRPQDLRNIHPGLKERAPMQFKQEPKSKPSEPRERIVNPKIESRNVQIEQVERVDMFGRTIRKDVARSPSKSPARPPRTHGRRKFSLSPSRSRSGSGSRSRSSSSSSRSRSRSHSLSRSRSGSSSSGSSVTPPPASPISKRKAAKESLKVEKSRKIGPGTVSYGESNKSKAIDLVKVAGQKQQIKLTLKRPGPVKPVDKTVLDVDDDSGESDTDARILKKRKVDSLPVSAPPAKKKAVSPTPLPTSVSAAPPASLTTKKPSAARREELLKQLRAVEDAIARKRSKPL